jgi:hypothetical protein
LSDAAPVSAQPAANSESKSQITAIRGIVLIITADHSNLTEEFRLLDANGGQLAYRQTDFKTIPSELEECALIDGASRWQILTRIVVPLDCWRCGRAATRSMRRSRRRRRSPSSSR